MVNRHNGALFERRLIERFISEHNKCPLTGEPLSKEDLISVSGGGGGCGEPVHSIPSLMSTLQSEWDAAMLEQFSLRQQLTQAHQELSHALYQHEASCRVIAKLLRERDILLSKLKERNPSEPVPDFLDETTDVLPKEVVDEMEIQMADLKEKRGRRVAQHNQVASSDISSFSEGAVYRSNSTGPVPSALLSVHVHESGGRRLVLAGGYDGRISCFDANQKVLRSSMIGHTRPVRCITTIDDIVLSGSDDSTVRLWKESADGFQGLRVVKAHKGPVVEFAVLPTRRHLLSAGADGRVAFTDCERGFTLAAGDSEDASTGLSCLGLQPDGALAVTGSAGRLLIWDVRQMRVVLAKGDGSQGPVTSVCFNDDGYTMASSTGHGHVNIFDLRNIDKEVVCLRGDGPGSLQAPCNKVRFSHGGSHLAAASRVVDIYDWRSPSILATLDSHSDAVTDVAWGSDSRWIVTTSLDKTLRLYSGK